MNNPKLGNSYITAAIEKFAEENDYSTRDYGENIVGEGFVVLKHNKKDITISFVLTGISSETYIYRCVYTDLK